MESRVFKLAGVIVLGVAMCGQGMAQSAPTVPNVGQLEKSAVKLAVIGTAASVAVGVVAFMAHHHKSGGRKKVSKDDSTSRQQLPVHPDSGSSNGAVETSPAATPVSSSQPGQSFDLQLDHHEI